MDRIINNRVRISELPEDAEDQIAAAIKRLSEWAVHRYLVVDIYSEGKHNMIACYRDCLDGETRYVIAAIWRPEAKEYTFHS